MFLNSFKVPELFWTFFGRIKRHCKAISQNYNLWQKVEWPTHYFTLIYFFPPFPLYQCCFWSAPVSTNTVWWKGVPPFANSWYARPPLRNLTKPKLTSFYCVCQASKNKNQLFFGVTIDYVMALAHIMHMKWKFNFWPLFWSQIVDTDCR